MWQIMWMMALLPDWFWHLVTVGGAVALVVAAVLKRIPFISQYNLPIKLIGLVVLLVGIWMEGGSANEAKWQARIKEMEEQVKVAEEKAKEQNIVVQERIVEKTKVVKEKGDAVVQYVDRLVKGDTQIIEKNLSDQEKAEFNKKINELEQSKKDCPSVPQIIIDMHNKAASSGKEAKK